MHRAEQPPLNGESGWSRTAHNSSSIWKNTHTKDFIVAYSVASGICLINLFYHAVIHKIRLEHLLWAGHV